MTGFTKLFGTILGSTIWREDPETKVVWITMLAMANGHGEVEASIPGLAHLAGVPVEQTEAALAKFLSPDKYSRSSEHDGRRIDPIDGGWRLLNHDKYRYKMSEDDRKERDRIRKQHYRDKERGTCPTESGTRWDTTGQVGNVREIQQAEAEEEALRDISSNAETSDDSDLSKALQSVWDYYISRVERNPKAYSFTPTRKRKGLARLRECLSKTKGNLKDAVNLMTVAVDQIVASDWHMGRDAKTNGKKYCDWDNHLFGSYERMEGWWNQ